MFHKKYYKYSGKKISLPEDWYKKTFNFVIIVWLIKKPHIFFLNGYKSIIVFISKIKIYENRITFIRLHYADITYTSFK